MKPLSSLRARGRLLAAAVAAPLFVYFLAALLDFREPGMARAPQELFLLLAVVFGLIGQYFLNRSFVRWTERLRAQIRRLGEGERQAGLPGSAVRELREIDAAFDALASKLAAAEAAVADGQRNFDLLLEAAGLATWKWHLPSGTAKFNARWAEMLGYPPEEIHSPISVWEEYLCPDDRPQVQVALRRHLEGQASFFECEFRLRHRDGGWIWFFGRGRTIEWSAAGEPTRLAGTLRDITFSKATEEQLRERTEELATLVDAMPAMVWIARDARCRETFGNRMANALFSGTAADAASRTAAQSDRPYRIPPASCIYATPDSPMLRAAKGAPIRDSEIQVRFEDGRDFWIFGNAAPLFDGEGEVRGAVAAFVDITRFKASEKALRHHRDHLEGRVAERTYELAVAKESAERANHAKSRFLANVAHELRTPLSSLMLLARLLADHSEGKLPPQQLEYVRMIELSGNDLLQLIDELLDLAKIEIGQGDIRIQSVPFPDVMQNVQRTHRHVAKQKGLNFRMEIDADVPPAIVTDPVRLQQLLRNLLANAIDFTRRGGVVLRIRRAVAGWRYGSPALARAECVIAFDVVDSGIGIAPERQRLMLDAGADLPENEHRGAGLGLSIALEIAAMLGGELALTSIPGGGSTFTLYLPLAYAGPAPQAPIPEESAGRGAAVPT